MSTMTIAHAVVHQVNQQRIVHAIADTEDGYIVLAYVPESVQPWVTWYVSYQGVTTSGHYFESNEREAALADFAKRTIRGF